MGYYFLQAETLQKVSLTCPDLPKKSVTRDLVGIRKYGVFSKWLTTTKKRKKAKQNSLKLIFSSKNSCKVTKINMSNRFFLLFQMVASKKLKLKNF